MCAPSASAAVVRGELQAAKAPPSTLQANVDPASLDENVNVGVESSVGPDGPPVMLVSGGLLSKMSPVGENTVRKERVADPPAGTSTFQLSAIPLSIASSHAHVFGNPPTGGFDASE